MRDGSTVLDPRLGRLKHFDERSRNFEFRPAAAAPPHATKVWVPGITLDQGQEGTCVGHGCAHEANATPVVPSIVRTHLEALAWFDAAAKIDPWPGDDRNNGTSVLAGMKVGQSTGFWTNYRWAFDLEAAIQALMLEGPLVMGTNWYSQMYDTQPDGRLVPEGYVVGGHCWLVYGYVVAGDLLPAPFDERRLDFDVVLMQNSWGYSFGRAGRAFMAVTDWDFLRRNDGEVAIPVGRKDPTFVSPVPVDPAPKPKPKWRWVWDRWWHRWKKILA